MAAWGASGLDALRLSRVNDGSIAVIGKALLTTYSLAFELISLALLVAIVGALAIARTGRSKPAISTEAGEPERREAAVLAPSETV